MTCAIVRGDKPYTVLALGTNGCDKPQAVCPRAPGEDYTKCRTVCEQAGHAEMQAVRNLRDAGLYPAVGAHAYVSGHYWICEPCGRALRDAGVTSVTINA
jgi:deoxycytidylate deaminase